MLCKILRLTDNYRPISLLNVDLKLISHVLAQRLKKVLPKIINIDQTGYVKNRFIGFNLYTRLYICYIKFLPS
jgi:hypothetical protein